MYFNFITTTSLSLLLFLSTSIQPAFALHTQPNEVTGNDKYSLTLMSNPTRILVSENDANVDTKLKVETFKATEPWGPDNVGPDNFARMWNMYDGLESLHNVYSNGYLYFKDNALKTDGQVYPTEHTHINLVAATGSDGGGIKIRIMISENVEGWVDENGSVTRNSDDAAVWAITKLGKFKNVSDTKWMRRSRR